MTDQRDDGGRPVRQPPAGPAIKRTSVEPGIRRTPSASQGEPELLTHPATPAPRHPVASGGGYGYRYDDGYLPPSNRARQPAWRTRWLRARKFVLAGLLLAILTPVLAFFAGWLFLSVPSPAALAAQRKQITTIMASDGT
ncbi:MAG: hypothetical protein ACRDRO_11895, partial [Pseudonocardiaceae bacterium]